MRRSNKQYINRKKRRKNNSLKYTVIVILTILLVTALLTLILKLNSDEKNPTPNKESGSDSSKLSSLSPASSSSQESSESKFESDLSQSQPSLPLPTSEPTQELFIQGPHRDKAFADLQEKLNLYAYNFNGRIGISYINLAGDESLHLGEKQPFVAASSIKMAIVTKLFEGIRDGKYSLTQEVKYDSRPYPQGDFEAGGGIVGDQANGTPFSLERTAQLAITVSDNSATNMVIRVLGGIDNIVPKLYEISAVVPYRESIIYKNHAGQVQQGKHRISSLDLALYAQNLYDLWLEDREVFDPLMTDLKNTVFNFGLHADLPAEVEVAHKIGTNSAYTAENDVGIIFAKEPFVLSVMTDTASQQVGRKALSEITRLVYDYIESLYN